jgi:hypothetical protein
MPWLTYQQIGDRFGMNAEAARGRVRRLGWRTQPGNDGRTLAFVPDDIELHPGGVRTPHAEAIHPDDRVDAARLTGLLAAAEAQAERADVRADEAGRRADAALLLADRLSAQLAEAGDRADRAEGRAETAENERRRGEVRITNLEADLRAKDSEIAKQRIAADQARAEAQEARQTAERLRQKEAVWKARGLLARLRGAWRGE